MNLFTQLLNRIDAGDQEASKDLLPMVYDELRKLAQARLASHAIDRSIQATELVHEAYVRLVDVPNEQRWNSQGHFFAAAAEAMRRILVERARERKTEKRGADARQIDLLDHFRVADTPPDRILSIDEALDRFQREEPVAAQVVMLRVFAGQSIEEIAEHMSLSPATVYRHWAYARAWLRKETA